MESRVDFVIEDHMGLINKIANDFKKKFISQEYEDLFQVCAMGMMKAIKGFDASKGVQFSTYAYRVCRNEIHRHIKRTTWFSGDNKNKRYEAPLTLNIKIKELDVELDAESILPSNNDDLEEREWIILLKQLLTKREFETVYMFYVQGWTNREIAKILNLCEQYTSRVRMRAIRKLREGLIMKKDSLQTV